MTNIKNQQVFANPTGVDRVLLLLNEQLESKLTWLDNTYTKAEKRVEVIGETTTTSPAVYTDQRDYLRLFPDTHLGNFSFYDTNGITTFEFEPRITSKHKVLMKWVVWFDYRTVFPSVDNVNSIENVKEAVLSAFKSIRLSGGQIKLVRFLERSEQIYSGYTNKEIETQFLMRPYGALALEFELTYNNKTTCL